MQAVEQRPALEQHPEARKERIAVGPRLTFCGHVLPVQRDLARISVEIAQSVMSEDEAGQRLPAWFLVEVARDLPRLAGRDSRVSA